MYEIRYADGWLRFDMPPPARVISTSPQRQERREAWRAVHDALRAPLASRPLAALAHQGARVCVAVGDPTENSPDRQLVPPIVTTLERADVAKEEITILVACGARRPSTPAEKEEQLGTEIVQRYKVIDHDASDERWLADLGPLPAGGRLAINRRAVTADLLISTGSVGADMVLGGLSGGAKTVALGCAGIATLDRVARQAAQATASARQGLVDEFLTCAARRARHVFALNAVTDGGGRILAVAAGEPRAVHEALLPVASAARKVFARRACDVAVLGVGWPYDLNLRLSLASAAACLLTPVPVVRPGGTVILAARLPEGVGASGGELSLGRVLAARARGESCPPGDDPINDMVVQLLRRYAVIVVGAQDPALVSGAGLGAAQTIEEALVRAAERSAGALRVAIVEQAARASLELG